MSTNIRPFNVARSQGECTDVAVGVLLPDYIVELLEEPAAEAVEEHLVTCRHCKERYLTILRARGAVLRKHPRRDEDEDETEPDHQEGLSLVGAAGGGA